MNAKAKTKYLVRQRGEVLSRTTLCVPAYALPITARSKWGPHFCPTTSLVNSKGETQEFVATLSTSIPRCAAIKFDNGL